MSLVGETPEEARLHRVFPRLREELHYCKHHFVQACKRDMYRIVFNDAWATEEHFCSGIGPSLYGGRWNVKQLNFRAVYSSLHIETAVSERLYYARRVASASKIETVHPILPSNFWDNYVLGTIAVDLTVLDMGEPRVVQRIKKAAKFSHANMIEEWRGKADHRETLTQALGRAAKNIGLGGLLVPSARRLGYKNLVAFPANIVNEASLKVLRIEAVPTAYQRLL